MSTAAQCNGPAPALISSGAQESPESSRNISPSTPWLSATRILIICNVVIFYALLAHWRSVAGNEKFLQTGIGADFDRALLLEWGADYGPLTLRGEFWRLVISIFLHANIVHLALNMLFLWRLGKPLDRIFGRAQALALFLLTGAAGSMASMAWHPMQASVGSSGAVYGQGGVLIALLALARGRLNLSRRNITVILIWLVLLVPFGLLSGHPSKYTDYAAHAGGIVSGLLIGAALAGTLRLSQAERVDRQTQLLRFATVAWIAVFAFVTQWSGKTIKEPYEASSFSMTEPNFAASKAPVKTVFLDLKGDPKLVHRFSTFLNLELENDGIAIAKSSPEADAVIDGEVHAKSERKNLGFGVIETQISANSSVEKMESCASVSTAEEGDFFQGSAGYVASQIRDKYPGARTVSLDTASDMAASQGFGSAFPGELKTSGFTVVRSAPADITVRIHLVAQKISVDESLAAYDIRVVTPKGAAMFNKHGTGVLFARFTGAPPAVCSLSFADLRWLYENDPLFAAARELASNLRVPNSTLVSHHVIDVSHK